MNVSPYVTGVYLASSMKCLFLSFAHGVFVPFGVVCFLLIDIEVLYFLGINPLLFLGIADIFSQFAACLFTVFLVSSEKWTVMWLNRSLFFLYSLFFA